MKRSAFAGFATAVLTLSAAPAFAEMRSEVRMLNGHPALYVNGAPTSQILASPYRPTLSDFDDFWRAGVRIFDIYLRFDWSDVEGKRGHFDWSYLDSVIEKWSARGYRFFTAGLCLISLPSTQTAMPSCHFAPATAIAPSSMTRPPAISSSASRREHNPDSLMYLFSRMPVTVHAPGSCGP